MEETTSDSSLSEARLLYALQTELPSMRVKLQRARLIGEWPDKTACRNRVLVFMFRQGTDHVIEWLLVRSAEAIRPLLQNAHRRLLGRELIVKNGRVFTSYIREFEVALHIRDAYIGHRIMNLGRTGGGVPPEVAAFGGIYGYLEQLLTRLDETITVLEGAGLFDGHDNLSASSDDLQPFEHDEVRALIEAANSVGVDEDQDAV